MAVVYVSEQGAIVHKNRERLMVKKGGELLQAVHLSRIEQLVLFGYVQVTSPATHLLLQRGIDTVYLTKNGRFRGRLQSHDGKNIELRLKQFRCSDQPSFLVDLAGRFVRGKIQNCRLLLRRQQQRLQSPIIEQTLIRLRASLARTHKTLTLDELRGVEGYAAAAYFDILPLVISNPSIPFRGRSRRPPRDPMNALLSFGYALLLGTIQTAVQIVGLDPYLGSLHTPENSKPSLVLDLMEEFRPLLVDSLMLTMVNRGQIQPHDFRVMQEPGSLPVDFHDPEEPRKGDYPVLLRPESLKKVVLLYELNLQRTLIYAGTGTNLTLRQICLEQARKLARHYLGQEQYEAFTPR
jgi:CRISPR-associated protein Cas1